MTSQERVSKAMTLGISDRVPLMCQLSIGHYFLNSQISSVDIWLESEGFAEALVELQKKYNFDGILINLPGRDPDNKKYIKKIKKTENETKIIWKNDSFTVIPHDDNPHFYQPDSSRYFPTFDEIDPDKLFYLEPWDLTEIKYPYKWSFEKEPRDFKNFFPTYHGDIIKAVKRKVGDKISVHSEIFSPWSQFLELLNYESGLMAIMDDPAKVKAILERLTEGTIALAKLQVSEKVDAILISSAFAGAGLIAREHYIEFVLPYERKIITEVKKEFNIPIYTHTCGSIGDRLDLMLETKTNGIDTLDPPPLGTVELQDAKKILTGKAFIKGNIDPVNTLLLSSTHQIKKDVEWRINVGKENGGFILSSACSVSPKTPPQNIMILSELIETFGRYL
jgi:hypothetical protein